MSTVKMTSPEGEVKDIVLEGVRTLEALGWKRVEVKKAPAKTAVKRD